MNYYSQNDEDKLLTARIKNLAAAAENKFKFGSTFFLDERQVFQAESVINSLGLKNFLFWGGYKTAQRQCAGFFPDNYEINPDAMPITPITFEFRNEYLLSHRDFLGSFMSLGISRGCIGDIIVSQGIAVAFIYNTVADEVKNNIRKIGRVGVSVSNGIGKIDLEPKFITIEGTVASMRIDCLVGLCTNLSRSKSANILKQGLVKLNHETIFSPDSGVCQNDLLSIRGYGRFKIIKLGNITRKNRIHITINKYV